jgi:hypothetical protein
MSKLVSHNLHPWPLQDLPSRKRFDKRLGRRGEEINTGETHDFLDPKMKSAAVEHTNVSNPQAVPKF